MSIDKDTHIHGLEQLLGGFPPPFSLQREAFDVTPGAGGREKRLHLASTQDLVALHRHQSRRTFAPQESPQWRRRSTLSMGGRDRAE